jgi:DNA-binding MarR family transcriptional regulator
MQELEHALRRSSGQGAIYSQTVADVAGIASSDMDCLDFLNLEGRVTAGRLAEVTGLTTGAITGVIDRLERTAARCSSPSLSRTSRRSAGSTRQCSGRC